MEKDIKLIKRILEAIETSVEKEWENSKPKLEKPFGKVSDSGDHEMSNAKANYASVKDGGTKKLNTEPAFSKIKDPGANGGAKQNVTPNKQKNPYKENTAVTGKTVKEEFNYGEEKIPRFGPNKGAKSAAKSAAKSTAKVPTKTQTKATNASKPVVKEEEELTEISTNMKKLTDRNPCINENENYNGKINLDLGFFYDQLWNDENIPEDLIPTIMNYAQNSVEDDLMEISTNMKKMTDRNPAMNESVKFEATLSPERRNRARKLREAIEAISGKKVVYQHK